MARILIIEDNQQLADMFGVILSEEGHDVTVAYSGASALEHAAGGAFQFVLCDIKMEGIDGLETVRRMKSIQPEANYQFMTGYMSPEETRVALELSGRQVLTKPFSPIELVALAARHGARPSPRKETFTPKGAGATSRNN